MAEMPRTPGQTMITRVNTEIIRLVHQAFLVGWLERGHRGVEGDSEEAFEKWWSGRA